MRISEQCRSSYITSNGSEDCLQNFNEYFLPVEFHSLCHVICTSDNICADFFSTFELRHSAHNIYHQVFIKVVDNSIRIDVTSLGYEATIEVGIILNSWCPPGDNFSDGVGLIATDVTTEDHESSTQAIEDVDELFKLAVGGVGDFAQPRVAYSNIEGVIVADSAWNLYRWL